MQARSSGASRPWSPPVEPALGHPPGAPTAARRPALRAAAAEALPSWAVGSGKAARRAGRRITSPARSLPAFVVIGAQKGGTSSLYNYLTAHPAIVRAATKEIHFFDVHFDRGVGWYRSHFPTRAHLRRLGQRLGVAALTGEASPYYLFHPDAPHRLRALIPEARLIVVLRDPVARAISHYHHEVEDGFETLALPDALAAEPRRLGDPFGHQHHSYLSRGRYAEQLEAWFTVFPREQFLIADSAELFADPAGVAARTVAFLGLFPHRLAHYGVAGARPRAAVDVALRRRLYDEFAPHNRRLYALLGRDFGWEAQRP